MSALEVVKTMSELGEKTPAIFYSYLQPHPQLYPAIAIKEEFKNHEYWISVGGLENLSSKVISPIRVKLNKNLDLAPIVQASPGITASFDSMSHEILISRLDPKDHIYVFIHLTSIEAESFIEPQVIVQDRMLSRGMRVIGEAKKMPLHYLIAGLIIAILFGFVYKNQNDFREYREKSEYIDKFINDNSGFIKMYPVVYKGSELNPEILARHKKGMLDLLVINKVDKIDDLYKRDKVIVFE